jgi:hypothetical protein
VNGLSSRALAPAAAIAAAFVSLSACGGSGEGGSTRVNGSVHIRAGKTASLAETVNGAVDIDADATVTDAKTVNGGIHLARAMHEGTDFHAHGRKFGDVEA